MRKVLDFIKNTIFYTIIVFLIFICVVMVKSKVEGKQVNLFGYELYGVLTGSMSPTIDEGSLVIVKKVSPEEIKVRDIITFRSSNSDVLITHRVKEIVNDNEINFITKGDANNTIDPAPIRGDLLVGKVVHWVPKVGSVIITIKDNMIAVVFGIVLIIILISIYCIGLDKSLKKENDEDD